MRTAARVGDGPAATTKSTQTKPVDGTLTVPFRKLTTVESISLGFRQEWGEFTDAKGKVVGHMMSGAGWGTDALIFEWRGEQITIRASEILAEWVATFDPDGAEGIRKAISGGS